MALVNEYTFGEMTGTSLIDSIGTNTGTLAGTVSLPTWSKSLDNSKIRKQLDFVGGHWYTPRADYNRVEFNINTFQYASTDNFSYSILFKSSKADAVPHELFAINDNTGYGIRIELDANEKIYVVAATGASYKTYATTASYCDGKWHMITVTFTASGLSLNLYVDSVLHNEGASNAGTISGNFYTANAKVTIGALYYHVTANYQSDLTGSIAYFANYNHTLSASEIQRITEEQLKKVYTRKSGATYAYLPPKNTVRDGLVNEYYLDSPDGVSTVTDYAGTNAGTKGGATQPASAVGTNGMNQLAFTGGNGATAGNRQRVDYSTNTSFQYTTTDSFSFALLFKTSTSVYSYMAGILDEVGTGGYIQIRVNADGTIAGTVQGGFHYKQHKTTKAYNDGEWHIAVLTWDNNTMKFYIDNVDYPQTLSSGTPAGDLYRSNARLSLSGAYNSSTGLYVSDFDGSIAYFANYNKALTPTEIDKIYRDTYIS